MFGKAVPGFFVASRTAGAVTDSGQSTCLRAPQPCQPRETLGGRPDWHTRGTRAQPSRMGVATFAVRGPPSEHRFVAAGRTRVARFGDKCVRQTRGLSARNRVVLMPSLWRESFGRVAAEALLNGIPVLASRRGALPEVLRDAGFLFDVPERYTPHTRLVPTPEEVAPWVETVIRLWDDRAFYEQESARCVAAAEAWRPERLASQYDAFFRGLLASRGSHSCPNVDTDTCQQQEQNGHLD